MNPSKKIQATLFLSSCCGVKFEGRMELGRPVISCEKCGKYAGTVSRDKKLINRIYKT